MVEAEKLKAELREIRYLAKKGPPAECSITNAQVVKVMDGWECDAARLQSLQRWYDSFKVILNLEPLPQDKDRAMFEIYGDGMINFYP